MRVSDDRYNRDRLRLDVALRFIRHEARTRTIRQWTGLSDDRIRKLYHSYLQAGGHVPRHRGKSPQQAAYFLRTTRVHEQASALASLFYLVGLFDADRHAAWAAPAKDVACAVALCQAYDGYRATVRNPAISFEHAALLVRTLVRGTELRLGDCEGCGALLVIESLQLRATRCLLCSTDIASGCPPRRQIGLPNCNSPIPGSANT